MPERIEFRSPIAAFGIIGIDPAFLYFICFCKPNRPRCAHVKELLFVLKYRHTKNKVNDASNEIMFISVFNCFAMKVLVDADLGPVGGPVRNQQLWDPTLF